MSMLMKFGIWATKHNVNLYCGMLNGFVAGILLGQFVVKWPEMIITYAILIILNIVVGLWNIMISIKD